MEYQSKLIRKIIKLSPFKNEFFTNFPFNENIFEFI